MAQYPLDMGRPNNKSTSNALAVQLDADGRVKYDVLARQGHHKDKVNHHFISIFQTDYHFPDLTRTKFFNRSYIPN